MGQEKRSEQTMKLIPLFIPDNFLTAEELETKRKPDSIFGKIFFHPLTKIFIGIAFLSVMNLINTQEYFFAKIKFGGRQLFFIINSAVLLFLYSSFIRLFEKRKAAEIGAKKFFRETIRGFFTGAVLINLLISALLLLGYYKIAGVEFPLNFITLQITRIFFFALLEEIVFRLIIFRYTELMTGTAAAVIISSVIFGAAHFINPNATVYTTLLVILQSIFIISPAYLLTRRIWFVAGLHFAWNFFQRCAWSLPVSGKDGSGIVKLVSDGPTFITGGNFGPEASIITIFLCAITVIAYFKISSARKYGR